MGNVKREIERLKEKKRKRLLQDREKKELEKLRWEEEPSIFDKIGKVVKAIDKKIKWIITMITRQKHLHHLKCYCLVYFG